MDVKHSKLKQWVDEMAKMTQPDSVVWIDGSKAQRDTLTAEALSTGELVELDQKKLPGCYFHRSAINDVARTEHLTFICTSKKEDVGPTNNWMEPKEGYTKAAEIFNGSMKGRTMYVIPFSMGPVGSKSSKIGVQCTDSIYVVLNMQIMARAGEPVLEVLGADGAFTKCMHGKAQLDIDKRLILHFPEDNAIWSVGSGYGGNALLGKKCLALRIASALGRKENWMAEHMLILGVKRPNGDTKYITGAFPSACGKTNLAMLIPPAPLKAKGYEVTTVGDDIAWLHPNKEDGRLWAINPEAGFFGVAPGTNYKTNFNAMTAIQKNTIYTNVLLTPEKTVWWEDGDGPPPAQGINWEGKQWTPGMKDAEGKAVVAAHPNSRYTAPLKQCPSASPKIDDPAGVPVDAFIFGGRRATLAPLVYEALDWKHGVFVAATMASELTAAQVGTLGKVRRDPMAMLPFCGYNMADYFDHWFKIGESTGKPPRIFHVNWFRRGADGKFLWPGYGDNLRVIEWILKRCAGEVEARETPIGYVPYAKDIDTQGLDMAPGAMDELLEVPSDLWKQELETIEPFFKQFGEKLPRELWAQYSALQARLGVGE